MGRFIVVALVAAVVGAAAVYWWVVYTESEPPAVDDIVAIVQGDAVEPDPREPITRPRSLKLRHVRLSPPLWGQPARRRLRRRTRHWPLAQPRQLLNPQSRRRPSEKR